MQLRNLNRQFFIHIIIIAVLLLLENTTSSAQTVRLFSIRVYVVDHHSKPIHGALIKISPEKNEYLTAENGVFTIRGITASNNEISISFIGKRTWKSNVKLEKELTELTVELEADDRQLNEVNIQQKSAERRLREQSILTQIINTKKVNEQPTTMVELLNRSAGIRVRQSGGLGASANVAINGFQGRSVKFFKDGIPLDYLGSGFDISLLPVNMLDHIEVYKAVLPRDLGADALGAAINLVTKTSVKDRIEASYEIGSFQTHRASLNLLHKYQSGIFVGADAFINYARNNYNVDVQLIDQETAKQNDHTTEVELYHNQFKNYYTELYAGIVDRSWTDELRFGITVFGLERELPFGSTMSQPYGAARYEQNSVIPTARYRKKFMQNKLSVDQFLVANTIHTKQVDTAKGQYDWFGNYISGSSQIGEVSFRGSLAKMEFFNYTSKTTVSYPLSEQHNLGLNIVFSGFNRTGSDPFGRTFLNTDKDVLSAKARYNKTIMALGLDSKFWSERITNSLITKYFAYDTKGIEANSFGHEVNSSSHGDSWGIANATKFQINNVSYLRLSAEYALRLPEQDELFGDGGIKLSNFALKPERSTNLNLGYRIDRSAKYSLELNTFYRITEDMIHTIPYNLAYLRSDNLRNVKGLGVEADVNINLLSWLVANANFSYLDMRLYNEDNILNENSRMSNTPYFFTNTGLTSSFSKVLNPKDKLQTYWNFLFVRQYYLNNLPKDKEPNGFLGLWGDAQIDARNIIPSQSQHTLGFTYFPSDKRLSLGFQVKNLLDADVFDNFRLQNAGRAFYLKINYSIN